MKTYSTISADDESAIEYLHQVVGVDGPEAILAERPVTLSSGRVIGTQYEVSDDTADFIAEAIRRAGELEHE